MSDIMYAVKQLDGSYRYYKTMAKAEKAKAKQDRV